MQKTNHGFFTLTQKRFWIELRQFQDILWRSISPTAEPSQLFSVYQLAWYSENERRPLRWQKQSIFREQGRRTLLFHSLWRYHNSQSLPMLLSLEKDGGIWSPRSYWEMFRQSRKKNPRGIFCARRKSQIPYRAKYEHLQRILYSFNEYSIEETDECETSKRIKVRKRQQQMKVILLVGRANGSRWKWIW